MAFLLQPGLTLRIDKGVYKITEHPQAPGMPYGQEGRRAVVYQLRTENDEKYALKVFKSRFRIPRMVAVSETLEPYAVLNGMQACRRTVLTGSRHPELLREFPDLTYAVLMPWVEGSTWQEILLDNQELLPDRSLQIAKAFARQMMLLEEKGLAHCDLSGPNLIIQPGDTPALVDLEETYGPGFLKPETLPAGSPGYAHKSAPLGIWNTYSDRFAGVILLAEMLCWFDSVVKKAAWGESYFAPKDMQVQNRRLETLRESLENHYGGRILDLFDQAWRSDSLRDCPTFAEWAVALPEKLKTEPQKLIPVKESGETLGYYPQARKVTERGEKAETHSQYQKEVILTPPDLSDEIENHIKILEDQVQDRQNNLKQLENESEQKETGTYPSRQCPVCGGLIPKGQEICPFCEGATKITIDENTQSLEGRSSVLDPDFSQTLKVSQLWWKHWGVWVGLFGILSLVFTLIGSSPEPEVVLVEVEVTSTHGVGKIDAASELTKTPVEEINLSSAEDTTEKFPDNPGLAMDAAAVATQFWSDEEYQESISWTDADILNPEAPIYLQSLLDNKVDTSQYKMDPPFDICFSNAGVNNQWRVNGYVTMREQVEQLRAEGLVRNFIHVDAEGSDEKQITEIADLLASGQCDVLIISPNNSEALTPAVEQACEVLPTVVFDRGVLTDCPTTFLKTIGGYKYGYDGAKFIVDNLPDGGNVLALRILPGVDLLEQRWGGARKVFEEAGNISVVGVEFNDFSELKTKTIVTDYVDRFGYIDAVWMDAGGPAVAALEAYEDLGLDFPVMVGEDQMDYLKYWKENDVTGIAPSFPTFQWRTAVLAAVMILLGEPVDARWVIPQPNVTWDNLDEYYLPNMPSQYFALSSAEDMYNWPDAWKELDITVYIDVIE